MQEDNGTLKYIKIFLLVVFLAALISVSYKIFLSYNNSSFKYDTYNLLIAGSELHLVRISKSQKKISVFTFNKSDNYHKANSKLARSLEIGSLLDGEIIGNNLDGIEENFMSKGTFFTLLMSGGGLTFNGVNAVDVIKLFFSSQVPKSNKSYVSGQRERIEEGSFYDEEIFNEKMSVQIINATGVDGLGAEMSFLLEDQGYNVVSVESGDDQVSSIKAADHDSRSLKRLMSFFSFPVIEEENNSISDITIILGKDFGRQIRGVE